MGKIPPSPETLTANTASEEPKPTQPPIPDAPDTRDCMAESPDQGTITSDRPDISPAFAKPTIAEFNAFKARCTKLVRDILPKAGKDAPNLLLPYLKRVFGVAKIQDASVQQWRDTLTKLEQSSPSQQAALLRGNDTLREDSH